MSIRKTASLLVAACAVLAACDGNPSATQDIGEPSFIRFGHLAGDDHPAVVLIIADVGGSPAWRCSGTLIAPDVVLTAGHCVGEPGEVSGMRIFTEADVQNGDNDYPWGGGNNTVEAVDWASHPDYTNAAFFRHDVGVMVLAEPVVLDGDDYGVLPEADAYDNLRPRASARFTAVGYGLQRVNPVFVESQRVRMYAEPHLIQTNSALTGSYSFLLSNNASTGGTCFGDSGGPNYWGSSRVVAGVTSFGLNGTCGGTGGVFRMDRQDVLDFVNGYLP